MTGKGALEEKNRAIADLLLERERFNLVSHIRPDGDSIGSLLALGEALSAAGKEVQLFTEDPVPRKYAFLKGSEKITSSPESWMDGAVTVALDCTDLERTGTFKELSAKAGEIINIDHHVTNCRFGTANLVVPQAAATGEIIFFLLESAPLPTTKSIAEALYVAIATDTGSFKFENTSASTHRAVAALLERHKLNTSEISEQVFDLRPLPFYILLKNILGTLELYGDKKLATITASRDMLERCGAKREDLDGIINYTRNIEGIEVGVMFYIESPSDETKVGFRSKNVDVSELAKSLGGGGHARAAGCRLEGPYDKARERVIKEALQAISSLNCAKNNKS